MRDDVNWHEVEACVGSEFVYVVIALAAAVFHSCLLLICLTGVLHMIVEVENPTAWKCFPLYGNILEILWNYCGNKTSILWKRSSLIHGATTAHFSVTRYWNSKETFPGVGGWGGTTRLMNPLVLTLGFTVWLVSFFGGNSISLSAF